MTTLNGQCHARACYVNINSSSPFKRFMPADDIARTLPVNWTSKEVTADRSRLLLIAPPVGIFSSHTVRGDT
jgi:hypothetical protein